MSHDIEAVTARWQRRNADGQYRFPLFHTGRIGDIPPGTMVYDRLRLAIAVRRVWHALRAGLPRLLRPVHLPRKVRAHD